MSQKYSCPVCGSNLTGWICSACGEDIRLIFNGKQTMTSADITDLLRSIGAYWDVIQQALVIPSPIGVQFAFFCPNGKENADTFRKLFAAHSQMSATRIGRALVDQYFMEIKIKGVPPVLPKVGWRGDHLFLQQAADDTLFFPAVNPEDGKTRIMNVWPDLKEKGVMYYTGEPFTPQPHDGIFEEFLDSCRCADEENRHALRTWCLTVMLSGLCPPGQFPALLLAAPRNGVGKTSLANVLGHIFGHALLRPWDKTVDYEKTLRQIMDESCRFLVADNMRSASGAIIDDSMLASLMTQPELAVMTLWVSSGSTTAPNRIQIIATANRPMFSSELLSRFVIVSLARPDKGAKLDTKWEARWIAKRQELVEDIMHTVIQNWARGPLDLPCKSRFGRWWEVACRATQREPVVVPSYTCAQSPIELIIGTLMEGDRMLMSDLLTGIHQAVAGPVAQAARQREWDEDDVIEELQVFHSQFKVEEVGGQRWVVRSVRK